VLVTWAGVTTEEKYTSPENKIKANYYVDSIADFFSRQVPNGSPPAPAGNYLDSLSRSPK